MGILPVQPCASSLVTSRCLGEGSKVPSQNVRTGKGAVVRTQLLQTSGNEGEKGDTLLRCLGGCHRGNRSSPPGETNASCTEPLTCFQLTSFSLSLICIPKLFLFCFVFRYFSGIIFTSNFIPDCYLVWGSFLFTAIYLTSWLVFHCLSSGFYFHVYIYLQFWGVFLSCLCYVSAL